MITVDSIPVSDRPLVDLHADILLLFLIKVAHPTPGSEAGSEANILSLRLAAKNRTPRCHGQRMVACELSSRLHAVVGGGRQKCQLPVVWIDFGGAIYRSEALLPCRPRVGLSRLRRREGFEEETKIAPRWEIACQVGKGCGRVGG